VTCASVVMRSEFSDDEWAEALCFTLAIMAASGFIQGRSSSRHDMAMAINQVVSSVSCPILWRMTPAGGV
jgi:hypothetical protein